MTPPRPSSSPASTRYAAKLPACRCTGSCRTAAFTPPALRKWLPRRRKNIEDEIVEIGERTIIDLGIHGLHPELIKMVGRMRFRSSYGQNLLQHSREVAKLCATMAAELGLNVKFAKRAGLLHDIGKVRPEEPELPHAILGMELAKKYKEHPDVCNAIGAHHDEIEMTTMISPIVQACDAISGSRPGARREDDGIVHQAPQGTGRTGRFVRWRAPSATPSRPAVNSA